VCAGLVAGALAVVSLGAQAIVLSDMSRVEHGCGR
jgi:hypothetical protein